MNRCVVPSVLVGLLATGLLALEKEETAGDALKSVAPELATLLETQHVGGGALDDARSRRIFDAYFASLDPARRYFQRRDLDAFSASRDELDDQFRRGDFGFAIDVGERLVERVESVSRMTARMLDAPLDLARNEYGLATRAGAGFPESDEEQWNVWRKSLKLRVLERVVESGESTERAQAAVGEQLQAIHAAMRRVEAEERIRRFIDVVTASFDPHTRYLPPDALSELEIHLRLRLVGIGVILRADDGRTVVGGLVPGGPAERQGTLRDGDEIVAVAEGADGPWVDLAGTDLREAVNRIRGAEGTTVRLRLRRTDNRDRTKDVVAAVRRAPVRLRADEAQGQVMSVESGDSEELSVGVLRLPAFYSRGATVDPDGDVALGGDGISSSTRDARTWIEEFASRGVGAIVLDLRGNAGGLLEEAVGVASLFLDGGAIVQIAERGVVRVVRDVDGGSAWDGPLVVLTDRLTASAGEIVAGALADHGRALVVGDASTHGKGTVQTLAPVTDPRTGSSHGALKVTTAKFYLPSGPSPQLLGVVPHVALPSATVMVSKGESSLPGALPFDEIPPVDGLLPLGPSLSALSSVVERSRERRSDSSWFQGVEIDLRRALEASDQRWIPLERGRFTATRAASSKAPSVRGGDHAKSTRIERDPYLEEVLAITRDYVRESRG